ncbi:MAG TPA: penicillin acylase family protein, partial [Acidobacteriota bacterium]|nr:penicillin acylase family protein [Acidobacteriota bacterium]
VYRDEYGVPHIYAPTAETGLYAMGYCQAEDRLEEMLKNYMRATGEMASAFGPAEFLNDLQARLWQHYEIAKKNYGRIRPEVRRHLSFFVRGINDYMSAHPAEIPSWWGDRKVDVYMAVAHSRQFMWGWPAGQALVDLRRGGITPNFSTDTRSSNEMAIAPGRTSVRAPILIIDPHLSWWGAQRFWEFRIHAGELHGSGFTIPGSPYVGLGHNDYVAWAMTTGGPDTADIYKLALNPANPLQYKYDEGWKTLSPRKVTIQVKGESKPRELTFYDSHNGPVVSRKDNEAYLAKLSYADQVQFGEAFYLFNIARNVGDFRKGLELNQIMPQNVMVADTSGNIYYQRTGRVPIRPDGFDFTKPVDGSTSRTEWLGIHPARDLMAIENPAQGYMQNCNIPPDVMMVDSALTPDKWKSYLFNEPSGQTHQRAARAVQLLQSATSVTPEQARAIALDTYCYQYDRWSEALKQADERFGDTYGADADYQAGLREIVTWNGRSDSDSKGALKYYYWRRSCSTTINSYQVLVRGLADYMAALARPKAVPTRPTDDELKGMVSALAAGMRAMRSDFGTLDLTYGQVFRVGRDDQSWPVGGGSLTEEGMATVRAVGFGRPKPDHTRWGDRGQTSTQVVILTKPIQSWTQPPIGQSDYPDSPFYRDQAEKLFSKALMKPTWYQKGELLKHVISRVELKPAQEAKQN